MLGRRGSINSGLALGSDLVFGVRQLVDRNGSFTRT
jgi:hypothetical protein